jgi:hypothetical protein
MYLELYDSGGKLLKKLPAGNRKGINQVQLATIMEPPKVPKSPNILGEAMTGPDYEAGNFRVKVVKGDQTFTTDLVLGENPDLKHNAEDRKLQRETLMKAYNLLEKLAGVDEQILSMRDSLANKSLKEKGTRRKRTDATVAECSRLHELISATQGGEGGITGQVRLRENIAEIYGAVLGYKGRPTNLQIQALDLYSSQVNEYQAKIKKISGKN